LLVELEPLVRIRVPTGIIFCHRGLSQNALWIGDSMQTCSKGSVQLLVTLDAARTHRTSSCDGTVYPAFIDAVLS
jgi:hypothetical protein